MAKAGVFIPFAASVLLLASFAAAQEKPSRFTITGVVSGSDEYTVTRSATGTSLPGHTNFTQGPVTAHWLYRAGCGFQITRLPNYSITKSLDLVPALVYNFSPSGNGKSGENPPLPRNCNR